MQVIHPALPDCQHRHEIARSDRLMCAPWPEIHTAHRADNRFNDGGKIVINSLLRKTSTGVPPSLTIFHKTPIGQGMQYYFMRGPIGGRQPEKQRAWHVMSMIENIMHQFEGHDPSETMPKKWRSLHLCSVSQIVDKGQRRHPPS